MHIQNTRTVLSVLFYGLITIVSTILLLEKYGAEIVKYQLSYSVLFSNLNGLKYSGFGQWDALLPLTTFLLCLVGGLICAWLFALFLKAFEGVPFVLLRLTSRSLKPLNGK